MVIQAPPKTTLLLPKNGGLAAQARAAAAELKFAAETRLDKVLVRGEDVPFLACELVQLGQGVVAITGEDLLQEWLAGGSRLPENVRVRTIPWTDSEAVYGKPALCAIGRPELRFAAGSSMRIGMCRRYTNLTGRYVAQLRAAGIFAVTVALEGTLETLIDTGIADIIVDIVVTGRTIRERGLVVHNVLCTSDLVVLEAGNAAL